MSGEAGDGVTGAAGAAAGVAAGAENAAAGAGSTVLGGESGNAGNGEQNAGAAVSKNDAAAEGGKTAGDATGNTDAKTAGEGDKAGAEQDAADKQDVAYQDFTFPEGVQLDQGLLGEFKTVAKELGLKQEQAQALADLGVKQAALIASKFAETQQAETAAWLEATKVDKEFGGEQLEANLAVAKKAFDAFATPELKAVLDKTGLGNHPELIRAFFKAGKLLSEDKLVPGGTRPAGAAKTADQVLYPNHARN